MDAIAAILKRIKTGARRFAPENDSLEALKAFQTQVQLLREAEKLGLVDGLKIANPSKGRDTYGLSQYAIIRGGLSDRGEQYLAVPPRRASKMRAWVVDHLAQIAVGAIGAVIAAIVISRWGLQ